MKEPRPWLGLSYYMYEIPLSRSAWQAIPISRLSTRWGICIPDCPQQTEAGQHIASSSPLPSHQLCLVVRTIMTLSLV
jgi:hypothetical protein